MQQKNNNLTTDFFEKSIKIFDIYKEKHKFHFKYTENGVGFCCGCVGCKVFVKCFTYIGRDIPLLSFNDAKTIKEKNPELFI